MFNFESFKAQDWKKGGYKKTKNLIAKVGGDT